MPTALIIGSGPGAAGAALALAEDPTQQITVIDVGHELEDDLATIRSTLASTEESTWSTFDVERISHQPVGIGRSALPQKRAFGSDFPFRDVGQFAGVRAVGASNPWVVSGAYGGFSNVWGAQIMPFSRATFDCWPVAFSQMESHYGVALDEMTLAGDSDDLAELFPLLVPGRRLPPLADRTASGPQSLRGAPRSGQVAWDHYRAGATGLPCRRLLALWSLHDRLPPSAHLLGLPYLRSPAQPRPNLLPTQTSSPSSRRGARDVDRYSAEYLHGCDRPVDGRPDLRGLWSRRHDPIGPRIARALRQPHHSSGIGAVHHADPLGATFRGSSSRGNFTLNQFNLLYDHTGEGVDLCQIHFYDYNPAFLASLPSPLRAPSAEPLLANFLRRISVGLGYVPGWASPGVKITAQRPHGSGRELADLVVDREGSDGWPPMLTALIRALLRVAPTLDLWPVLPMLTVSAAAKSYHFGASFPHSSVRTSTATDRQGRLDAWDNIHLVDASVFPSVPATTFTLTIMANAHRIASEALRSSS